MYTVTWRLLNLQLLDYVCLHCLQASAGFSLQNRFLFLPLLFTLSSFDTPSTCKFVLPHLVPSIGLKYIGWGFWIGKFRSGQCPSGMSCGQSVQTINMFISSKIRLSLPLGHCKSNSLCSLFSFLSITWICLWQSKDSFLKKVTYILVLVLAGGHLSVNMIKQWMSSKGTVMVKPIWLKKIWSVVGLHE